MNGTSGRRGNGEGTYIKRADGRWQYRVRVLGHRINTYGRTKTEAKEKAKDKIRLVGRSRAPITLTGLLVQWGDAGPVEHGLAPTTFDQYHALVRGKILPSLGDVRVDALTKRQVATVFADLGGAASTRRSTYAALVRVMDFAVERGLVGINVVREVKRPATPKAAPRSITRDQAVAITNAAKGHRWEAVVWLALGAGLRRGEILGLRWADVDLESHVVHITGNVTRSSAGLTRGEPKTRRGRRRVPLPSQVIDRLKAHRRHQIAEQLALGAAWTDSGHVITNEIGGVAEPRKISRVWSAWATQAGVPDKGMHAGRHFASTILLSSGRASVADVAAMLGHDPSVLLNTYATAVADGQRAASAVLGDALVAEEHEQSS